MPLEWQSGSRKLREKDCASEHVSVAYLGNSEHRMAEVTGCLGSWGVVRQTVRNIYKVKTLEDFMLCSRNLGLILEVVRCQLEGGGNIRNFPFYKDYTGRE